MDRTVTIPKTTQPRSISSRRPRLRILYSPQSATNRGAVQHIFSLPVGESYLGRKLSDKTPGFALSDDPGVSAEHAIVSVADETYQVHIQDVGSRNGTYVGKEKLSVKSGPRVVQDGEVLRIGNTFLLLRYEPANQKDVRVPGVEGVSLAMRELRVRLGKIADQPVSVLLLGETGTGKDVVAKALHALSQRAGELVAVNCAAIPESLAESELFGHVAGAFSDARERTGRFRHAHRGSLFLDEIGDMPAALQAKLLRVLDDHTVSPVGSEQSIKVDVRVLAATNRDLTDDIGVGLFRRDLYNRLAQLELHLPSLRARREDVLPLLQHLNAQATAMLTPDVVHDLLCYDWPGNVRELSTVGKRMELEGVSEGLLLALHRPPMDQAERPLPISPVTRPYRLPVPARERLESLLRTHLGTISVVSEELHCSRRQVQRWLDDYGINADDFRR